MFSWWWLVVMFLLGAFVGFLLMGIIAYDNAKLYKDGKRWWDDDQ